MTPGLDKAFLNIIEVVDRDETLFGQKLSEKIKASKVIEKQGLQIKKTLPTKTPPTSTTFLLLQPAECVKAEGEEVTGDSASRTERFSSSDD